MFTKIGSLPFLREPTCLWKFRQISESPKRHWISVPSSFSFAAFDPKTKTNFEEETLYREPISVTPSDSRMWKIPGSRIFLWVSSEHIKWPSSDFEQNMTPQETCANLLQFTSSSNRRSLAQDSPQEPEHNLPPKVEQS